jgi:hypothetical protein
MDEPFIPIDDFSQIKTQDDISHNAATFIGTEVIDYDVVSPSKPKKRGFLSRLKGESEPESKPQPLRPDVIYRFRSSWDEHKLIPNLEHFIASDLAPKARGIVIGIWDEPGDPPDDLLKLLVDSRERLPHLAAIYFGDITSEENEMSWIKQLDLSPVLKAFPKLQLLRSRGGDGLALAEAEHANLRGLALETGGMDVSVVRSICTSDLPNLEYLELWLGTDEYGANTSVADLQPILSGRLFPKLKYLGLRNSQLADEIAAVLVNSPLVQRIDTLDLSLGTLTDEGANALLKLPPSATLKNVNLHYNYVTNEVIQQLKKLPLNVDASKPTRMDEDEDEDGTRWRFVAVGE